MPSFYVPHWVIQGKIMTFYAILAMLIAQVLLHLEVSLV